MTNRPMIGCTHSGAFHADDVFATALLKIQFDDFVLTRSRDPEVIASADIVYDVGGICDPEKLRFDHHMADFPKREDGRPYSSVGLIWDQFGVQILSKAFPVQLPISELRILADDIDRDFMLPIDMIDNGVTPPGATDITVAVDLFNPTWTEDTTDAAIEAAFANAVDFARGILLRQFNDKYAEYRAEADIYQAAMAADDPRLIQLARSIPFRNAVHRLNLSELLYVVSPSGNKGNWGVTAVSVDPGSFVNRKDMPAAWAGLTDAELQSVSGVDDAIFAHRSRFFAVAKSKSGALALAEAALNAA